MTGNSKIRSKNVFYHLIIFIFRLVIFLDTRTAQGLIEEHPTHFKDELVFFTSAYLQPRRNLTNQKPRKSDNLTGRKKSDFCVKNPEISQGVKRKSSPGPIGPIGSPKRSAPNWDNQSELSFKLRRQNAEFEKTGSPQPDFMIQIQSKFLDIYSEGEIQVFPFGSMELRVPIIDPIDRSSINVFSRDFSNYANRCALNYNSFAASAGRFSCAY